MITLIFVDPDNEGEEWGAFADSGFAISKSHWSEPILENDGFKLEWGTAGAAGLVSGGQVVLAGDSEICKSATGWQ